MAPAELDALALRYGTDKSSRGHGYTTAYQRVLGPLVSRVYQVLELGIWEGASLRMWRDFFPLAQVHGVDHLPVCPAKLAGEDRIFVHTRRIPQELPELLQDLEINQPFDLIIDDAGHHQREVRAAFLALWPLVRSGGYYAVEDLHTATMPEYAPPGEFTFLQIMADANRALHGHPSPECDGLRDVSEMLVFPELCFFKKR